MDQLDRGPQPFRPEWLWEGYLARGNITLLTSRWKAGKTTLLCGLLRTLAGGGTFLNSACAAAKAIVVSEELPLHWTARQRAIPIGPHARLVSRPFSNRPTTEEWDQLVRLSEAERQANALDLFVVDPLASFLPGRSESDPATLLDMVDPLRRLAATGVAVLVLHHPRKGDSEEGSRARGSGALLGFVDISLEIDRPSGLSGDVNRRRLTALSRHPVTPPPLIFEWTPGTADFRVVADIHDARFQENWKKVEAILAARTAPSTHRELLQDWPVELPRPSERQLYEWLSRAVTAKLVHRSGDGTKRVPFRFRLKDQAEYDPIGDPAFTAMLEESVREAALEAGSMIEAHKAAVEAQRGKPEPLICVEVSDESMSPETMRELVNRELPKSAKEMDDDEDDLPPPGASFGRAWRK